MKQERDSATKASNLEKAAKNLDNALTEQVQTKLPAKGEEMIEALKKTDVVNIFGQNKKSLKRAIKELINSVSNVLKTYL